MSDDPTSNALDSTGTFSPPSWAPPPTTVGTSNAGLASSSDAGPSGGDTSTVGSTADGRAAYDAVAAQWTQLITWWSADADHHGLAWIQPQIAHWQQLAVAGYQNTTADLASTKQDLELCISYAVPAGYDGSTGDTDSTLDAVARAAAAPFKLLGEAAALPFTLPFKLGEQLGDAASKAAAGIPPPTSWIPSWVWWGLGLSTVGGLWLLYESGKVALRAAPAVLPFVAPEALPYLAALQGARGARASAPVQARVPAQEVQDPLQAIAAAFGTRGSQALARLAQLGNVAGSALGVDVGPASSLPADREEFLLRQLEARGAAERARPLHVGDRRALESMSAENAARAEALLALHDAAVERGRAAAADTAAAPAAGPAGAAATAMNRLGPSGGGSDLAKVFASPPASARMGARAAQRRIAAAASAANNAGGAGEQEPADGPQTLRSPRGGAR